MHWFLISRDLWSCSEFHVVVLTEWDHFSFWKIKRWCAFPFWNILESWEKNAWTIMECNFYGNRYSSDRQQTAKYQLPLEPFDLYKWVNLTRPIVATKNVSHVCFSVVSSSILRKYILVLHFYSMNMQKLATCSNFFCNISSMHMYQSKLSMWYISNNVLQSKNPIPVRIEYFCPTNLTFQNYPSSIISSFTNDMHYLESWLLLQWTACF
jgi:hypothetical protein